MPELIRPSTILPADRSAITISTSDGLSLVGEVATPKGDITGSLLMLHPNPSGGGMMDSHIYKKAANRLPFMAGIQVIRFNTRGTKSEAGQSAISQGIGALLNFGITAFSSNQNRKNLQGQANIVAQQGRDALTVEQERTKQAQLALEASRNQGTGAGGNTALYIGLGVVGVVVLGILIFVVTRKRSA